MKKENLIEFLSEMTDKQFSFFYRNRKAEFMAESITKIENEKCRRKLTDSEITDLSAYSVTFDKRCPKCQSENYQEIIDTKLTMQKYTAYEIEFHSKKCRICGFNAFKNKPLNFKMRFNKWRGKYHWKKVK